MRIVWHKYHALQNDFLVIESSKGGNRKLFTSIAKSICNRHTGVGADGILVVRSNKKKLDINIYNADGSWAEMSGNGARIAAYHIFRTYKLLLKSLTMGGREVALSIRSSSRLAASVSAEIGTPVFATADIPVRTRKRVIVQSPVDIGGLSLPMTVLSVGNPHAVLFVDSFDFEWPAVGQLIETSKVFPRRINVEFVRVVSSSRLEVRLWERGVGITGSSGTGSAAALVAAVVTGRTRRTVTVVSTAGKLKVAWKPGTNAISIEGAVNFVASGSFEIS
jgi:diaminopimelate epimerase